MKNLKSKYQNIRRVYKNWLSSLRCGLKTSCYELSLASGQLCKPFIKSTDLTKNPSIIGLSTIIVLSTILIALLDLAFLHETAKKGVEKSGVTFVMAPSVILFSAVFSILIQESFSPVPFCALNMNEKICNKRPRYSFHGTFGNESNPIFVSSPCRVEPTDGLLGHDLKPILRTLIRSNLFLRVI